MATRRRRLTDKVIEAFEQACDEGEIEIAEELFWALEAAISRATSPAGVERRATTDSIARASARLEWIKAQAKRNTATAD